MNLRAVKPVVGMDCVDEVDPIVSVAGVTMPLTADVKVTTTLGEEQLAEDADCAFAIWVKPSNTEEAMNDEAMIVL